MHTIASNLLYLTIIAGVILAFAAPGGTAFHHTATIAQAVVAR